jgi:hypothetical protein
MCFIFVKKFQVVSCATLVIDGLKLAEELFKMSRFPDWNNTAF